MRRESILAVALAALFGLTGCLSIEQDPCEAGATMCVEGDVWACRDDGSGWDREAICPGGTCANGQCVLEPLPDIGGPSGDDDASAEDDTSGTGSPDAGSADNGSADTGSADNGAGDTNEDDTAD